MATSLASNLNYSRRVAGLSTGNEFGVKNLKRDWTSSSMRCLWPSRVLRGEQWKIGRGIKQRPRRTGSLTVLAAVGKDIPDSDGDKEDVDGEGLPQDSAYTEIFRREMEEMIRNDAKDARFEGKDLAALIRNKYGRSYDVQLIKKEFLGRQLLAMNVMWKYREQRSFPLTEEEYLLHLDYIAENLRGWGAVSYVRNSLEKTRERPRIGKAVSIFINPDESGERSKEWIKR